MPPSALLQCCSLQLCTSFPGVSGKPEAILARSLFQRRFISDTSRPSAFGRTSHCSPCGSLFIFKVYRETICVGIHVTEKLKLHKPPYSELRCINSSQFSKGQIVDRWCLYKPKPGTVGAADPLARVAHWLAVLCLPTDSRILPLGSCVNQFHAFHCLHHVADTQDKLSYLTFPNPALDNTVTDTPSAWLGSWLPFCIPESCDIKYSTCWIISR